MSNGFSVLPAGVPDFPSNNQWVDHLRWTLAVMNADDDDMAFAASLLSHCRERGGLTEKQAKYAKRMVDRVRALWLADQLACQSTAAPDKAAPDLLAAAVVGSA